MLGVVKVLRFAPTPLPRGLRTLTAPPRSSEERLLCDGRSATTLPFGWQAEEEMAITEAVARQIADLINSQNQLTVKYTSEDPGA